MRAVLVAGVPKGVVRREFGGGAWIAYVVDGPERELITNETMRRMGMDVAGLHELAIANLDQALTDLPHKPFTPGSHVFLVKAGDDYESSRMLLPHLWHSAAREVKGRLLAAAPARNIVLFTGSRDFNDIATLMSAAKDLAAHEKHPISPTVFEFTGSGWRPAKKLP